MNHRTEFDWRPVFAAFVGANLSAPMGGEEQDADWPTPRYRAAYFWMRHRLLSPERQDPTTVADVERAVDLMMGEIRQAGEPPTREVGERWAGAIRDLEHAKRLSRRTRRVDDPFSA